MKYIATFYSHFGALRFKKQCDQRKMEAKMMPVPRDLSSSCGTCVLYEGEKEEARTQWPQEVEQAARVLPEGYLVFYRAENS